MFFCSLIFPINFLEIPLDFLDCVRYNEPVICSCLQLLVTKYSFCLIIQLRLDLFVYAHLSPIVQLSLVLFC